MWMFIQMLIFYAFRQIDGLIHRQLDRQIDLSSIAGWQKSLKFPCSALLRSKELLTFEDLSFVKPEELNETRNSWIGVAEEDMSLNVGGHNTEIIQYYIYICVIHICNVFTYRYTYIYIHVDLVTTKRLLQKHSKSSLCLLGVIVCIF